MASFVGPDILPESDQEDMVDFTCATSWERLSLDVELQLRAWNIHADETEATTSVDQIRAWSELSNENSGHVGDTHNGRNPLAEKKVAFEDEESPSILSVRLAFGSRVFSLQFHRSAPADIKHILGIRRCIVLASDDDHERSSGAAVDASDAASLLSALVVAAGDCHCPLPLIVRIGSLDRRRLIGRQVHPVCFRYCCDFTVYPSPPLNHLPGLLHLFHNKRVTAHRFQPPSRTDAVISATFTYYWSDFSFQVAQPPMSFANDPVLGPIHKFFLTDGDPISHLVLSVMWNSFHASSLHEYCSTGNADTNRTMLLNAASAFRLAPPHGPIPTVTSTSKMQLPLTTPVRMCLRMAQAADKVPLGHRPGAARALVDTSSHAVSKSSKPVESQSAPSLSCGEGIIAEVRGQIVTEIDDKLEPKVEQGGEALHQHIEDEDNFAFSIAIDTYLESAAEFVSMAVVENEKIDDEYLIGSLPAIFDRDLSRGLIADVADALGPSAPSLSIIARVARLIAAATSLNTAQRLWNLFVDGVELHWTLKHSLHSLSCDVNVGPDFGDCLLVQKLQMINCCIDRMSSQKEANNCDPLGRKRIIPDIKLIGLASDLAVESESRKTRDASLTGAGDVWEPSVLPLPLVTRDLVEAEQEKVVLNADKMQNMDSISDGSRRQVSALRSDMMAFKAANPGASLSDFVRWFSPRDWVCDEDENSLNDRANDETKGCCDSADYCNEASKTENGGEATQRCNISNINAGHLSERMSAPGNVWEEMWMSARPVPASKQLPLFDAKLHGDKALTDLRYMPFSAVLQQLACVLTNNSVMILQHAFDRPPVIPSIQTAISEVRDASNLANARKPGSLEALGMVSECGDKLATAEHMALAAASLIRKLPPGHEFVYIIDGIVANKEVEISSERDRIALSLVAGLQDGGWRTPLSPSYREFIMEGSNGDRMYVLLSSDEMRVGCRLSSTLC